MRTLRLYFFGPGMGESILIGLPCGQWGLVDCYQPSPDIDSGVVGFLRRLGVEELAFFCLSHPHADHFEGTDKLFDYLRSQRGIRRLWRHPGFTTRMVTQNILFGAKIQGLKFRDRECERLAEEYGRVLQAFDTLRQELPEGAYQRVLGPATLLAGENYQIDALLPTREMLEKTEARVDGYGVYEGRMALCDEEGPDINELSVSLRIKFGEASVLLLGDSQGADQVITEADKPVTVLKVAHHGSEDGYGAVWTEIVGANSRPFKSCVITPYTRRGLPRRVAEDVYTRASEMFCVCNAPTRHRMILPGMEHARAVQHEGRWVGLEVTPDGRVSEFHC